MDSKNKNNSNFLPWHIVEKAILKEMAWLESTIPEAPFSKEKQFGLCKRCIYRQIAILIVSGKVKAKEIKSTVSLFGKKNSFLKFKKPHGKEWHQEMMGLVSNYFKSQGYKVEIEPKLVMGRADLGVYKKHKRDLFIEIGSVSLPKLLVNLKSMEGSDFLLVIDQNHVIEFSVKEAASPLFFEF